MKWLVLWLFWFVVNGDDSDDLWVSKFIGKPRMIHFDESMANAIVLTNNNVIGSIDINSGELNWRQVLSMNNEKIDKMVFDDSSFMTLSGKNKIRKWDSRDGTVIWETQAGMAAGSGTSEMTRNENDMAIYGESNLAYIDNNVLSMIYRFDGSIVWSNTIDNETIVPRMSKLLIDLDSELIFILSYDAMDDKFIITSLTLGTGKMVERKLILVDGLSECVNENGFIDFEYFDSSFGPYVYLNILYLCNNEINSIQIDKENMKYDFVKMVGQSGNDAFPLMNSNIVDFKVLSKKETNNNSNDGDTRDILIYYSNGNSDVFTTRHHFGNVQLQWHTRDRNNKNNIYCLNNDNDLSDLAYISHNKNINLLSSSFVYNFDDFLQKHGNIESCYFDGLSNLIILTLDNDVSLFRMNDEKNGMIELWTREESLANVLSASMFDESKEDSMCTDENECENLVHRQFPNFFQRLSNDISRLLGFESFKHSLTALTDLLYINWSENLGSKMITLLTKSGKLYGISSENGNVEWSLIINSNNENDNDYEIVGEMLTVRQHPPMLLIVLTSLKEKRTKLVSVSSPFHIQSDSNGPIMHESYLDDNVIVSNAILTSKTNDDQIKYVLLPSKDGDDVHVWPKWVKKNEKDELFEYPIYYYNINDNKDAQSVTGYSIYSSNEAAFKQRIVWNKSFLASNEEIISYAFHGRNEHVINSIYRTGELGAIYKYLNPHLFGIATYDNVESILNVYLMDGITGYVYEHNYHRYSSKHGVSMLLYENKFLYSFWDNLKQLTQLMSIDLWLTDPSDVPKQERSAQEGWLVPQSPYYSNAKNNNDNSDSSDKNDNIEPQFSVYDSGLPIITSQTYNFVVTIDALLAVSETRFNVANRVILAKTGGNSLITIDTRFVNTRRPLIADTSMTQANREEGIMPYKRFLPFQTLSIISENIELPGIFACLSIASPIESTSLVFSYGLDLFFCKITPSKTFDMIGSDFDFLMLFGILIGVVAAIYGAKYFSQKRQLNREWS